MDYYKVQALVLKQLCKKTRNIVWGKTDSGFIGITHNGQQLFYIPESEYFITVKNEPINMTDITKEGESSVARYVSTKKLPDGRIVSKYTNDRGTAWFDDSMLGLYGKDIILKISGDGVRAKGYIYSQHEVPLGLLLPVMVRGEE